MQSRGGLRCSRSHSRPSARGRLALQPQRHVCSGGFDQALPIYQNADIVTISGSASDPALASPGTSIFNRVTVSDPGFNAWYAIVAGLPSDLAWQWGYNVVFGTPPMPFADLYFDATSLLIGDLKRVSRLDRAGNLVIDRATLARAVRSTARFEGVTCTITLDPATGDRLNDPATLARCAREHDDSDPGGEEAGQGADPRQPTVR